LRREVAANPTVEALEGRALLSHMQQPVAIAPAAVHAAKAPAAVFPPASDAYWQPLLYIDGNVLLPGPSIISRTNISRLIRNTFFASTLTPPKGTTYLYYGNHNDALFRMENHNPLWHVNTDASGRVFVQQETFVGEQVPAVLAGTVVSVVRDWTRASHDPRGDSVTVRTVFPDGRVAFVRYEHLQANIPVKVGDQVTPPVGDQVTPQSAIGLVGRTGGIPATGPTNLTIVAWTPVPGGRRYLTLVGTPHFGVLPNGEIISVSPTHAGCSTTFVDPDGGAGAMSDDPDNDDDDPGGICN
jgi:hypothetical protein